MLDHAAIPQKLTASSVTVLIVEDDDPSLKLFSELLMSVGYTTLLTKNGGEVAYIVHSNQPDLILMDIQLPDVSGMEVMQRLKGDPASQDIPIIAVTACAMKGDAENILGAGFDGYISKPISVKRFLETVAKFMGNTKENEGNRRGYCRDLVQSHVG